METQSREKGADYAALVLLHRNGPQIPQIVEVLAAEKRRFQLPQTQTIQIAAPGILISGVLTSGPTDAIALWDSSHRVLTAFAM